MLKQGSFIVFLILILSSCSNKNEDLEYQLERYEKILKSNNSFIYKEANDSIQKWIHDSLSIVELYYIYPFQLNNIFIFNIDSTRFYTTINSRDDKNGDSEFDYIVDFGGAKISGKWYFFFLGSSEPVDRAYWKDNYHPLTFEELAYVAYDRRFKTLIKNIQEGHPDKNEEFFKNNFYKTKECQGNWSFVKKCCDSLVLKVVSEKYTHKIKSEEITEINKLISKGNNLNETIIKSSDTKIFESREWKSRYK